MIRQLILVEKTTLLHESDDAEPQREPGQIKVTVYPLTATGQGAPNLMLNMIGDDASVQKSWLIVTRDGCCAEHATKAVYSLESGKYLFNTTRDKWATLGAKGGFAMTRIAAIHMAPTEADKELFKGRERGAAIISYASPITPLQRLMLLVPPGTDSGAVSLGWSGELQWVSASYPNGADHIYVDRTAPAGQVFTETILRFRLDENRSVDIPLKNDHLDITAAKLPKNFELVEMSVE
ncbi:MAG: hypothetical protein LBV29_06640 [Azoarcus sp.]|jgi:hypothetical protein|nr:hypothetical protein [Azoarcus sp.]